MPKVRPVHYVLGVAGISLIRNWAANPQVAKSRMTDLASLVQRLGKGGPFDLEMDIAEIEVRAGYREWAATYDSLPNPLISVEEPLVHHLIDQIPRGRVLDAASGTGRHARYLHSRGHDVVAMDTTPEMLDKLRAEVPEVECREGDLENLPFPDQSFDAVICALALTHLETLDRAIAEMTRVIRPGGFVILSDFHPMPGFLGGGGFFQNSRGQFANVRSFVHFHSEYIAAFAANGLDIAECREPAFTEKEALGGPLAAMAPEAFSSGLIGMPLGLIWCLKRR
jgi:ubiquinone/menaquinone biosynthesis C-methylase UbiE